MNIKLASKIALMATLAGSILTGCDDSPSSTGGTAGTAGTGGNGNGGDGGVGGTGGTGGGTPSAAPTWVAKTDPMKGELPEGLFVTKDTAYMGFAVLGTIKKVALADGTVSDFGALPPIPKNDGFLVGIAVDGVGDVYVGFGGGAGMTVKTGIYKIPAAGGSVTDPFATDPAMFFPNGLVFVGSDLFVADSGGTIFKVASSGMVTTWLVDPLLSGNNSPCPNPGPFANGANGIVKIGNAFYVSNSAHAQIVKIPIQPDGSAGTPSVQLADCQLLAGIDGIAVDPDGTSILAALNAQHKLARIDASAKFTELYSGPPLDNPASLAIAPGSSTVYLTNSSFASMAPTPGLLSFILQ